MFAMSAHAVELSIDVSQSFARRRHLPQPCKGALHHPSARQKLEAFGVVAPPDDFDSPATFALQRLLEFWPCITTISKDMAQKRVEAADRLQGGNSSVTILNGRAVNNNTDHKAIGVSDNVALAAP